MTTLSLNGIWNGTCLFPDGSSFAFSGTVPGCTIQDLITAEKLPSDIFWEKNADAVAAFENCDYLYAKEFFFDGSPARTFLQFERLDTYCDVFLNGTHIYHSENGNIAHTIPVHDTVVKRENLLEIKFYSPVTWVKDRPVRRGAFTTERLHTRRMQCTYGWDWVARFIACGLGNCTLVSREEDELIIDNVYLTTLDVDEESASVRADVTFSETYRGRLLSFSLLSPDSTAVQTICKYCAEALIRIDFDVPAPQLWYPLGYGEQPLYTFVLKDGNCVIFQENFGIRTVKIMQLPDAPGSANYQKCLSIQNPEYDFNETFSGFVLKVNGVKINCKGANWVPCVPFAMGDIRARQTKILELCAQAGVNMLRIWGGGAFETRHFYNECSRLGITVTQDFLMACGSYPEEEDWFIKELQKEAMYAAHLIRNQPCLMWWSGDNENAVNGCDTDENYTGRRSAFAGIAPVLYREDPHRRFLPSSPFGGKKYASNTVGTTHNTQYLGTTLQYLLKEDLSDYKNEFKKYRARFIAEEPQMGAVSLPTLRRIMKDEDIFNGDEMWLYHTKNNPALGREIFEYTNLFAEKIFGTFQDGKDRLFKIRYIQYEWLRVVMEQLRREKGFCSGMIFWMMNDCWPAASGWALIDYFNLPKDAYYAFKRCAKKVVASIDRCNGIYSVYVANDGLSSEKADGSLILLSPDKKTVKKSWEIHCSIGANQSQIVAEYTAADLDSGLLVCDIHGTFGSDRAFYRDGTLPLVPAEVTYSINETQQTITVYADSYVHAVTLDADAVFEDNCFSLLPGETRTICYQPSEPYKKTTISVTAYTIA
ncbi:MAG: hypothetical protein E7487_02375 [Ruminococcaceae bacterium]|nr:hypothetical protein [Oscillospiraceae bacterium]